MHGYKWPINCTRTRTDGVDLSPLLVNPLNTTVSVGAFMQQARCYQKGAATPNPTALQATLTRMMTCEFVPRDKMDFMGYSIRTREWRYTAWLRWDGSLLAPMWVRVHRLGQARTTCIENVGKSQSCMVPKLRITCGHRLPDVSERGVRQVPSLSRPLRAGRSELLSARAALRRRSSASLPPRQVPRPARGLARSAHGG